MHPLVRAILLGVPWDNKLHANAQAHPPHAQARETSGPAAAKGRPVVDPDHSWQTILRKHTGQGRLGVDKTWRAQKLHAEQVTALQISHGQRIAAAPVPGAKPALEIHRPNLVRRLRLTQACSFHALRSWAPAPRAPDQAHTAEHRPQSAGRGHHYPGSAPKRARSLARIFFGPHQGCCSRNSIARSPQHAALCFGRRRGARLLSLRPSKPSTRKRFHHL